MASLLFAAVLFAGASEAQAQRCPSVPPVGGPDPVGIDLADGVALVRAFELPPLSSEIIVLRTATEGRAGLISVLEEIAEDYCSGVVGYQAMFALRKLGQPQSYFLDLVAAHAGTEDRRDRELVYDAVRTLAPSADPALLQMVESLVGPSPGGRVEDAVDDFETILMIQQRVAADSLYGKVDRLLGQMVAVDIDGWETLDDGTVVFDTTSEHGHLDPQTVWAREELRRLTVEHPSEVMANLATISEAPYFEGEDPALAQAFEAYATHAALYEVLPWEDTLPTLTSLPAALAVAADDASGTFNGNPLLVSGLDHTLAGEPVSDGDTLHAVLATTSAAQQGLLSGLPAAEYPNVVGLGGEGDIASGALGFDPAAWIETLLEQVTVTLPRRPSASLVGTAEVPVVAYAPDGLALSGNLDGYGVLVVDGELTESGGVSWTGLVVLRGTAAGPPDLTVQGNAGIIGGVLIIAVEGQTAAVRLSGRSEVRFSRAALELAEQAAFGPEPSGPE